MPADRWRRWRWSRPLFIGGLIPGAVGGWGLILLDPPHLGLLWLVLTRTLVVAAIILMWLDLHLNFLIPLAEMSRR